MGPAMMMGLAPAITGVANKLIDKLGEAFQAPKPNFEPMYAAQATAQFVLNRQANMLPMLMGRRTN